MLNQVKFFFQKSPGNWLPASFNQVKMYWLLFDGNLVKLDRGICHSVSSHWTELEICNIFFLWGRGSWLYLSSNDFLECSSPDGTFYYYCFIITDCIILLFFYNCPIIAVSHHFTLICRFFLVIRQNVETSKDYLKNFLRVSNWL